MVEVEADTKAVERFLARLPAEAPPLARIERVAAEPVPVTGETGFAIRASPRGGEPAAPCRPDTATCAECLAELFDPADRRHRYPFINCTNCGPRFTIVRGVPYDRPLTTMAGFAMCAGVRGRVRGPGDRRFHAQPNACPECGPRALARCGADAEDAVAAAAAALRDGAIVAVKGVGGYHLACRADDEAAVARAARAQAPRGQAVRADGADGRGGAGAGRARAGRGGAARLARAADRAGAAAAGRAPWPRRWRRARPSSA